MPADDCCCFCSQLTVLTEASLHFTAVAAAKAFAVISLYYNSDWNSWLKRHFGFWFVFDSDFAQFLIQPLSSRSFFSLAKELANDKILSKPFLLIGQHVKMPFCKWCAFVEQEIISIRWTVKRKIQRHVEKKKCNSFLIFKANMCVILALVSLFMIWSIMCSWQAPVIVYRLANHTGFYFELC